MLNISARMIDNLAIIECKGIVQRAHEERFNKLIEICVAKGASAVLFDWTNVTYFDSMGLEALISIYKNSIKVAGVKIAILITDSTLIDAYKTLRLDKVIPLFETFENALDTLLDRSEAKSSSM
jgi:anti-anti-sigma factor